MADLLEFRKSLFTPTKKTPKKRGRRKQSKGMKMAKREFKKLRLI